MKRRTLLKTAGASVGGSVLGMGSVTAAETSATDLEVSTDPIHGSRRSDVIETASNSTQLQYVVDQLADVDRRPDTQKAIAYDVADDSGVTVQFGSHESGEPVIKYYRSDDLPASTDETRGRDDVTVLGVSEPGDGVRVIDGSRSTVTDVQETPAVKSIREGLQANDKFQRFKDQVAKRPSKFTLHTDRPRLLRDPTSEADRFVYLLPVTKDGEFHQFLRATGTDPEDAHVSFDSSPSGGHVSCYRGICGDWCAILCGVLSAGAGGGCTLACLGAVATAPIAPGCGVLCSAVTAGVCYPTCTNRVH